MYKIDKLYKNYTVNCLHRFHKLQKLNNMFIRPYNNYSMCLFISIDNLISRSIQCIQMSFVINIR